MEEKIEITLREGKSIQVEPGVAAVDLLERVDGGGRALVVKINDRMVDLNATISEDARVEFVGADTEEGLEVYRHSTSHVMASAVQGLFPGVKITIGPSIENGFYYDFENERAFTTEDFEAIESRMAEIIDADEKFVREVVPRDEAIRIFREMGESYKVEIIEEIEADTVSLYRTGMFVDLCRGPHLPSTGYIRAFKLLSVAGAYWRGDERNTMLTRIYGTAFPDRKKLAGYLRLREEAKKRDHRKLGRALDLFSVDETVGPGLICWHPKGALIRTLIEDFWRKEHLDNGYEIVYTPHIAKIGLWDKSGHTGFYSDNMYRPMDVDGQDYIVKPMNCPFHINIYQSRIRSYRELPIRWAELGTVYRYERSGVLHGLLRVRGFTQDDAHLFCRPDQVEGEVERVLGFSLDMLKAFGFSEYDIYLSTRPEKYVGSLENWELATSALKLALDRSGIPYKVDPGEGVFYGPKIDIKIKDSLGRSWQCTTIQVDFNMPNRFELSFIDNEGTAQQPIMIHRALLGSLERFFGCLLEHYAGALPSWLAPVQAVVLPIVDRQHPYSKEVCARLVEAGIRAKLDDRNEKLGYKIREAQGEKIPYMIVVGDREMEDQLVAPRKRSGEKLDPLPVDQLIEIILEDVAMKGEPGEA